MGQDAALQILAEILLDMRGNRATLLIRVPTAGQPGFQMVLHYLINHGALRLSTPINRCAMCGFRFALSRDPEADILPTCRELGIGFVPYSPLGRGFLTRKIKTLDQLDEHDRRRDGPRFQVENFQKNVKLFEALEQMAKEKGCKPAQFALAWVLAQGEDLVPIPGTTKRVHLEDNIDALNLNLSQEELEQINQIAPPGVAAGERYPEGGMAWVDL